MLVTWQSGIAETRFPGRLRQALPLLGDGVQDGLWPRELTDGFLHRDRALFVAETAFHPTQPGRVLTARRNRLYGTRRDDRRPLGPEPLGHGFEIVHRADGGAARRARASRCRHPRRARLGLVRRSGP